MLALFGLAAQLAPVQARVCAGAASELGSEVGSEVGGPIVAASQGAAVASSGRVGRAAVVMPDAPARPLSTEFGAPLVPAVLTGIDRARE